ncbi:DHH family phosphoesterase [Sulfurospirillum sp. 1307]|jgi:phosphoesterase RecJ-like protein
MYKIVWNKILEAKHIVLLSHIHPDGDTLGANLGLYSVLKSMQKKVTLFNATPKELPREFAFLDGFSKITDNLPKSFDLLVSCDCSSFDRLGIQKGDFEILNIDHHQSNTNFADINLVEPNFSSAGLVVFKLLEENKVLIPKSGAKALYTSIVEDTGFFRYGGIGAYTFKAVAKLVELGANPEEIAKNIKSNEALCKVRLRAYMLNNFELINDASIASIIFTKDVLEKTGATRVHTKNIVNELLAIANVKVALMVLEVDDYCKVSLRSDGSKDVSKISSLYGGGGHKGAAGFEIYGKDCEEVKKEIVKRIKDL